MCGINKKCACACANKKKLKENKSRATKKITITCDDAEGTLENVLNYIKSVGNTGHSFSIDVDKQDNGIVGASPKHQEAGKSFGWDGDGGDYIADIKIEKIGKEELSEKVLLEKINLGLNSRTKRDLVKQAKNALDAMYYIYDVAEKRSVYDETFLNTVDKNVKNIQVLLNFLVQQSTLPEISSENIGQ